MIRDAAAALLCSALYGYAVGSAHSELYAVRNLVKVPLLLLATGSICALANHVLARWLAPAIPGAKVRRSVLLAYRDTAVLLAALSPCVGLLAFSMRYRDDGRLGEYGLLLAFHVGCIALSGSVALWHQLRRLRASAPTQPVRALVTASLALSLAVGGQVAFFMRPFVGLPATRGGDPPPFFLGDEPDARGARNFYEAVWQVATSPPLPSGWGR